MQNKSVSVKADQIDADDEDGEKWWQEEQAKEAMRIEKSGMHLSLDLEN